MLLRNGPQEVDSELDHGTRGSKDVSGGVLHDKVICLVRFRVMAREVRKYVKVRGVAGEPSFGANVEGGKS